MDSLRRAAGIVAVVFAVTVGVVGCGSETAPEKPTADVAHDHDGDGVADHAPDEHDGE